jgi:hypothetical protein
MASKQVTSNAEVYGNNSEVSSVEHSADQNVHASLSSKINSDLRVFNIEEVASILHCEIRAVRHHLYEKRDLRYLKVGREVRVREKDIIEFLEHRLAPCIYDQGVLP